MVRILKSRIPGRPGGRAVSIEAFTGSRVPSDKVGVRGIRRLIARDPAKGVSGLIGTAKDILNLGRVVPAVQATLTTACAGANNDLKYTAKGGGGVIQNSRRIRYVVAGTSTALSVSVSSLDITVNVATDGGGAATSTAALVKAAVEASATAMALLEKVELAAGNDGTGVVAAFAFTAFSGGTDATTTAAKVPNTVGAPSPAVSGSQRSSGTLPRGSRGVGETHPNRSLRKR